MKNTRRRKFQTACLMIHSMTLRSGAKNASENMGYMESLGQQFPEWKEAEHPLKDYSDLYYMKPIEAERHPQLRRFMQAAEMLKEDAGTIVPIEASVGGSFTIASFLRGIERLLRDCRKYPEQVHTMMRVIVDSQKSVIDVMSKLEVGIAMADPVANPALIGPRLYEQFVYPYTMELTDYAYKKQEKKFLCICVEKPIVSGNT